MDYIDVLKKAFKITLKNRFFWFLGILAAGTGGFAVSSPNYNFGGSDKDFSPDQATFDQFTLELANFWAKYGHWVIIGALVLLVLSILFFIFGLISQGALISAADKADKGEKATLAKSWQTGAKNFWRFWGISILYLLMVLASLCLLIIPACIAVITGLYPLAIGWGILMFLACLAFWILVGLISPYSFIVAVLEDKSAWESIRESLHVFRKNWVKIVVIDLLLMAAGFAYGLAIALSFLIIFGILFVLGAIFWAISIVAALAYGLTIGAILIAAIVTINGAYKAFVTTTLVLTYNRLKS